MITPILDSQTHALSKEELVSNRKSLLADVESGEVPYVRKVEELVVTELEEMGCVLVRHGGNHDWYTNPATKEVPASATSQ